MKRRENKLAVWAGLLILAGVLLAGCKKEQPAPEENTSESDNQEVGMTMETPEAPKVEANLQKQAAAGVNRFSLDLYGRVKKEGNLCLSPYSAALALAVLELGAKGETAEQIRKALHFTGELPGPREALGALMFTSSGENREGQKPLGWEDAPPHELRVANSVWTQKDFDILESFIQAAHKIYRTKAQELDFVGQPEESRKTINDWTARQTHDRIKELVSPGMIHKLTRLMVVNAVYLKARWRDPFIEDLTKPETFYADGQQEMQVPMMKRTGYMDYAENDLALLVSLPYWSSPKSHLSMLVVLPRKRDGLAELESQISTKNLEEWITSMRHEMVKLSLPRFKTETTAGLKAELAAMGLSEMFTEKADLTGVAKLPPDQLPLYVDSVLQKTWIKVDEKGTEAAAATVMGVAGAGIPEKQPVFTADHPFLYLIREEITGVILFIGRVTRPV